MNERGRGPDSVARFNRWAPSYDNDGVQKIFAPLHRTTLDWVAALTTGPTATRPAATGPPVLLDVGCGTGALLAAAASHLPGARLVGVDPAEEMTRIARRRLPAGAQVICAGADPLPFADGAVAVVVSTMAFNFWPRPAEGLREVARVLAPGGLVVIADLFAVGWLRTVAPVVGAGNRPRSRPAMGRLLADAGLRVVGWRAVSRRGPVPILHAVAATR
ncbi:class I SAM-dependent methyltransferase [Micromonospora endolithica]|uniref:Methyltransferase domain-containing protein n=1 Tax=Micromonospora endolithica TaxID=230091 RepID=A0A3A9ZD58_9ACTN|nr:class I SAM-dependent methyltransferase [Micromonospora endolithica]RKN45316.1 methyltransferase domain-containing protein [Micromonospora endolithica]TWJ22991.1 methyltransferase family protein [Micromonospora endolithica]